MTTYRSKDGPIPIDDFGNDVKPKANPNKGYSPEFEAANKKKLEDLKAIPRKKKDA